MKEEVKVSIYKKNDGGGGASGGETRMITSIY